MKILKVFITSFIVSSCSVVGIQNEESPDFKIIIKNGPLEIRKYNSYLVAKTKVNGTFKESRTIAFKRLAGFIFGKNVSNKKIAMTSPVKMKSASEKIAMTSPVIMKGDENSHEMTFSMPKKYTIDTLPKPIDKNITIEIVPEKIIATIEFSGLLSKENIEKNLSTLRSWKELDHYVISSDYSYAGYNPPWTIPFLRKNEVHIELKIDKKAP